MKEMDLTPLESAMESDLGTFKTIYEAGHPYTDPKDPAFFDWTLKNRDPLARRQIFDYLIARGLNPRTRNGSGNLLHTYMSSIRPDEPADLDFFHHLLSLGLDPNETTRRYGTPMDILLELNRYTDAQLLPYAELLVQYGFDPTQPGIDGYTALQHSKRQDGSRDRIHTLLLNHARGS